MFDTILGVLAGDDLSIGNCRGQSYDNAANMSGMYSGVQARIVEVNPAAVFAPCSPHSLNLVGTNTVKSCQLVVNFFSILQQLYNFFSSSTHRWEILLENLKDNATVLKNLSKTRWSDQHQACKSVCQSWSEILNALLQIANNKFEKPETRQQAKGIHVSLDNLENCFISLVWNDILQRLNAVSKALQAKDCHLALVVELYHSLMQYVAEFRNQFSVYEEKAKSVCKHTSYKFYLSRKKKRKPHFDEAGETEHEFTGRDNIKVNMFYFSIDRLEAELKKRCEAYEILCDRFSFLTLLHVQDSGEIRKNCTKLLSFYPDDLGDELEVECLHLGAHLRSMKIQNISMIELSIMLHEKQLTIVYANVNVALRIYLTIPVSNCSCERSFSAMSRVKDYLRSTMCEERLNALSIMYIESSILQTIDTEKIINEFAEKKVRRVNL
ncbi:uncharacterized protein LOC127285683 [Leptopilina boulardi]|uniref:uncharacterized protein LOC127285683 n=1 Tax=Leptopilina boulardi TaxID=63433 RepID=UPI0021F5150F|nr:uncharacterized protein LOC127285683 [Leptopilina boulardi]